MTWGDLFITGGLFQTDVIVRCVGLRVGAAHVNGGTASCLSISLEATAAGPLAYCRCQ